MATQSEDPLRIELENRVHQQAAVAKLGHHALAGSAADLFEETVVVVAATLNAKFCKILENLPDGSGLLLRAGVGWENATVGTTQVGPGTDSQAGYTLLSDKPVVVEDFRTERRFRRPSLLQDHGIVSGISVTIGGRKEPFGVLGVHSPSVRRFTLDDADFMQSVANVLAAAIERRRMEDDLRDSQTSLLNILRTAADAIVSVDEELRITLFNSGAEKAFGYRAEDVLGEPLDILIPTGHVETHGRQIRAFAHEPATARSMGERGSVLGRRKDGSVFPAEVSISKAIGPRGNVFTAVVRDISERQLLQAQVLASQRLDAIGRLAGGIAHDFNNILTGITGFAELAQQRIPAEHAAAEDIAEITKVARRAARLTRQLLAFSRQQVLMPVVMQVNSVVTELQGMLRRLLSADIGLVLELDPGIGNVLADPGQIEQVVVNLVVNARDAMPDGGTLSIATRNVVLEHPTRKAGALLGAGAYCVLRVSDTGMGMSPENVRRAFEPFFTTKPRGQGTGMGLATVYGIVKQSGGYIFVDSVVNRGTTVTIYLPHAEEPAVRPEVVQETAHGSE